MPIKLVLSTRDGKIPVLSQIEYTEVDGKESVKRVIKSRVPTTTEILLYRNGLSDKIVI